MFFIGKFVNYSMKTLQLRKGKVLVDDEDFDRVSAYRWYVGQKGYAGRRIKTDGGKMTQIFMHRFIIEAPDNMEVDHRDHDKLNNQKSNLRLCTRSQNMANTRHSASKFKGVSVQSSHQGRNKYYRTKITVRGKDFVKIFSFTPEGELAAAQHYNDMAKKHFGEYASINEMKL